MEGWKLAGHVWPVDEVFEELEGLMYEVRNCVRGSYTGCKTYPELADYMRKLADKLSQAAEDVEYQPEEGEDFYNDDEE